MTTPFEELYRQIPLTKGQVAIVDAGDYEYLTQWKWHAILVGKKQRKRWYAARGGYEQNKHILIYMHRQILGLEKGDKRKGDHIEPSLTLFNSQSNLRIADSKQNTYNSRLWSTNKSGYKGVSWSSKNNRWQAGIKVNGKQIHLGLRDSIEEAAQLYREAAKLYFGEFARW